MNTKADTTQVDMTDPSQNDDVGNRAPDVNPAREPEQAKPEKKETPPAGNEQPTGDQEQSTGDTGKSDDTESKGDDTPLDTSVWGSTGMPEADAALQLLQNSGVKPGDAKALLFEAVQHSDITKVDQDALEAAVGKAKATLVMAGLKAYVAEQRTQTQATLGKVYEAVGGEDAWKQVAAWAKNSMPDADLDPIRQMIDAGGLQATLGAKELLNRYNSDSKNSTIGAQEQTLAAGGQGRTATFQPMSGSEYAAKLEALDRTHNGNVPSHLRSALLDARRRGREQGL